MKAEQSLNIPVRLTAEEPSRPERSTSVIWSQPSNMPSQVVAVTPGRITADLIK